MCIDIELLCDELKENFADSICPIGGGIIVNKIGVICTNNNQNFLHTFCKECFEEFMEKTNNKQCPICKTKIFMKNVVKLEHDIKFDNLKIKCKRNLFCNWTGTVMELENHEEKCDYSEVECCECEVKMHRKDFNEHIENICPEVLIKCELCSNSVKRKKIDKHAEKKNCEYCDKLVNKCIMLKHYMECPEQMKPCVECGLAVKNKNKESHVFECEERKIKCNNCNEDYKFTSEHDLHNTKSKCDSCESEVIICCFEKHIHSCPEILLNCKFVCCSEKFKRKDQDKHMQDFYNKHLEKLNDMMIDYTQLMKYFVENKTENVILMKKKIDGEYNPKHTLFTVENDKTREAEQQKKKSKKSKYDDSDEEFVIINRNKPKKNSKKSSKYDDSDEEIIDVDSDRPKKRKN